MNNQNPTQQPSPAGQPMSPIESPRQSPAQKWLPLVIIIVLAILVGGGILVYKTWQEMQEPVVSPVGKEVNVRGEVTDLDVEPLYRDGDGRLRLRTEDGRKVTVRFPAAERICDTVGMLDVFFRTKIGDEVEVFGKVTNRNEITLCDSADYYLKIMQ